ncbi:aminotransferase class I/II-fold pyridoxal phosphate-dependent enzyme [candidate division NPL-UPA2 bacterium Unc8]|uniref:Aminotransferase class I/II-fold pyridoxal phosphate-dependent enzyme n=1 Tax=candidate division NPL-UPA2 bacterium Unc8 TaxID=1980939 RepID=A0A399FYE7_UNCN2|nr:MAG: aminotransferase class I/II-fold pyridoxal phosphate-dependent enzyme [candidate division NPL-UPA2 bacterium Unc8]
MFGKINQEKLEARQRGVDVIDLGMGNPDQPPAEHIIEKLCDVAHDQKVHKYSASCGIKHLRRAICEHYEKKFSVTLDPESEALVTIGSKEGISHLMLAVINKGDAVVIQDPAYPSYIYSIAIAGGKMRGISSNTGDEFIAALKKLPSRKIRMVVINYPHNPTTQTADPSFFTEVVAFARKRRLIVVHDLAYADICFDGYRAPSFLQAKGAKEIGIEFYTLSKSYNMAGWRVGFALGNKKILKALTRIKGYYDYGIFTPIQVASIAALRGPQECVGEIAETYRRRRDVLVKGLNNIKWEVSLPKATMYVWAKIPPAFQEMGSLDFSSLLLRKGEVAVAPGIGFGKNGEGYVRFALVENEYRIRQAVRGIKKALNL